MSARRKLYEHLDPIPVPAVIRDHLLDAYRNEVLTEVTAWLVKKAREYRATGSKQHALQADTVDTLASKISRGAVRPDNLRMLPPDFFEPGHGYTHRNGTDFHCVAVTTHPQTGERLAMGWHIDSWGLHYPTTVGINQWNHEYDGVEPPTSNEDGAQ